MLSDVSAFSLLFLPMKPKINIGKFKINMALLRKVIIDHDVFPLDIKSVLGNNR